jgi:ketosteroid isomerase-like protein
VPSGSGYRRKVNTVEEVVAVNRRYYDAFERADLDAMSAVWERSPRVTCTHPGWSTLRGWSQVAAAFFALFDGPGANQFVLTEERTVVVGDMAWVSLDENLLGDQGGVTVATVNIFVRDGDGAPWRVVCHHGSVVQAAVV